LIFSLPSFISYPLRNFCLSGWLANGRRGEGKFILYKGIIVEASPPFTFALPRFNSDQHNYPTPTPTLIQKPLEEKRKQDAKNDTKQTPPASCMLHPIPLLLLHPHPLHKIHPPSPSSYPPPPNYDSATPAHPLIGPNRQRNNAAPGKRNAKSRAGSRGLETLPHDARALPEVGERGRAYRTSTVFGALREVVPLRGVRGTLPEAAGAVPAADERACRGESVGVLCA